MVSILEETWHILVTETGIHLLPRLVSILKIRARDGIHSTWYKWEFLLIKSGNSCTYGGKIIARVQVWENSQFLFNSLYLIVSDLRG